jgi:hypothetical protein
MMRFTLRDVFWLTLVVAMGAGWWMREGRLGAMVVNQKAEIERHSANAAFLRSFAEDAHRKLDAYAPDWRKLEGHNPSIEPS